MAARSGGKQGVRVARARARAAGAGLVLVTALVTSAGADVTCPWDCAGDDGVTGLDDVLAVLDQWGGPGSCDVDGGGVVDVDDLLELLANWGPCPADPACGAPGAGNCYHPHATPGCANVDCCNRVCAAQPDCCGTDWDAGCVALALAACSHCGDDAAGSCCQANGTPGCADEGCCSQVCSTDPYCCDFEWDALCAASATRTCGCP